MAQNRTEPYRYLHCSSDPTEKFKQKRTMYVLIGQCAIGKHNIQVKEKTLLREMCYYYVKTKTVAS